MATQYSRDGLFRNVRIAALILRGSPATDCRTRERRAGLGYAEICIEGPTAPLWLKGARPFEVEGYAELAGILTSRAGDPRRTATYV
jgi:hypothetical protein